MKKKEERELGFAIKSVNNLIRRNLDQRFADDSLEEVSGMQGPALGYICSHSKEKDIFQKDIEKEFNVRRSTATVMLQALEQKNLIVRVPVDHDGRLKKIVPTEKGLECHRIVCGKIDAFHKELEAGISNEEKEQFLAVLDKIKENLKKGIR